jgi:type IV pilus assembly protein PilA
MKNKAFTLIELLAVIIVLGILAVLIVPKVVNTLNESEKKTNMTSAENLVKAAEYKASSNEMKGISDEIIIDYELGNNTDYLDYSGKKPETGKIFIKKDGRIAMAVKIGDYCYLKGYDSSDIATNPYSSETCNQNAEVFINKTIPELAVSGDGLYEDLGETGRYIYRGGNPNNYIWLDENGDEEKTTSEIYRIISYEPDGTIKVIRDTSIDIGLIAWDKNARKNSDNTYCTSILGCNVWGTQENTYYNDTTLKNLNQEFFYKYFPNKTSQSLQNRPLTGTVTQNSSLNDYLNTEWAPVQTLNNYISDHSFNVGAICYFASVDIDKGLSKEKAEQNVYTWNGKIGLMNITDYVEASLNPTCTSVYSNFYYNTNYYENNSQTLKGYDNWPCSNRSYNWMSKEISEWFLSPNSSTVYSVWNVSNSGSFVFSNASDAYNEVRPAFYLKSTTKLGGFGTSENPYYIIES